MALPHKIEAELTPEDLEELRAFVREKNGTRTTDDVHTWVLAKGYRIGRTAVGNWMQKFREELMQERFSRSGELARAIKGAVSGGEFSDVADAAVMQLTQVVFEQAAKLESDGEVDPLDVQRMTKSLTNLVGSKKGLIDLLAQKFDDQAKKLTAKREITQADLDEVRKAVFG